MIKDINPDVIYTFNTVTITTNDDVTRFGTYADKNGEGESTKYTRTDTLERMEAEKNKTIRELAEALSKVRTRCGTLPSASLVAEVALHDNTTEIEAAQ